MSDKINPIKNLYDPFSVKKAFDDTLDNLLLGSFDKKVIYNYNILSNIKIVLSIALGFCGLYSYFHKEKFPHDKHIIFYCSLGYCIFWLLLEYLKRYKEKDIVYQYKFNDPKILSTKYNIRTDEKNISSIILSLKTTINEEKLTIIKEISDTQNNKILYNSKQIINYNEYLYETGVIDNEKLRKII